VAGYARKHIIMAGALIQKESQAAGWRDGLGCCTRGTGEGEGSVRVRAEGTRFRSGGTAKVPSLPADDQWTSNKKGICFLYIPIS